MNAKTETGRTRVLIVTLGTWVICVAASVAATWVVSAVFGFRFDAATPVIISSALVATGAALYWQKNA